MKRATRYALPGALEARGALLGILRHRGHRSIAKGYAAGSLREQDVMARLACLSIELEARGRRAEAKDARAVAILAAFLHEGKHDHAGSPAALQAFWGRLKKMT